MTAIRLHRVYDGPPPAGQVYLVDRVWPRGVRKDDLPGCRWLRDIAPSTQLRTWFGHRPERWEEFRDRYLAELDNASGKAAAALTELVDAASQGDVTLLFGARDRERNNAVVIREWLGRRR